MEILLTSIPRHVQNMEARSQQEDRAKFGKKAI